MINLKVTLSCQTGSIKQRTHCQCITPYITDTHWQWQSHGRACHTHNSVYCVFAVLISNVNSRCEHERCDRGVTHCIPNEGTPSRRLKIIWDTFKWSSRKRRPVRFDIMRFTTCQTSFVYLAQQTLMGQGLLVIEDSRSHSDTPHSVGILWKSDQPHRETSTWQNTTITTGIHVMISEIGRTHHYWKYYIHYIVYSGNMFRHTQGVIIRSYKYLKSHRMYAYLTGSCSVPFTYENILTLCPTQPTVRRSEPSMSCF
jgi:hypothetical protein